MSKYGVGGDEDLLRIRPSREPETGDSERRDHSCHGCCISEKGASAGHTSKTVYRQVELGRLDKVL